MLVSIIAAVSENNVIGKNGALPWRMPNDLKYFKRTTKGHHIIMGRKTFTGAGLNRPLPYRTNIVVSRQKNLTFEGVTVVNSLNNALKIATNNKETEAFIIGGEQIYRLALPLVDKIYLTKIHTTINEKEADAFFPTFNSNNFDLISQDFHLADEKNPFDYTFTVWQRKK